ncbi:MAG TPA: membrane dipeptidase, partial [Thermoanaerobaculia bacterium]
MRKAAGLLALALFPLALESQSPTAAPKDYKAMAARLHRHAIVVDTHEDVPERLQKEWVDIGVRNATGHVDIPRLKLGGVGAAFFAAYVSSSYAKEGGSSRKALELIDLIRDLAASHKELAFADSVAGIRRARRQGKIAILIGIEGGHAIEDSLGALGAFYSLGVRYMTLTHTNTNGWADSAGSFWSWDFDPKKSVVHDGLSPLGREVVLEMNRLGMLVDISHV